MERQLLCIETIPATLWGPASEKLFVAVHGDQSHREDDAISVFAEAAAAKGWQTLSVDLPEHGDRRGSVPPCKAQHCVADLERVMGYVRPRFDRIGLFGCSIGAYFGMLAFQGELMDQALFLSPVVDLGRVIRDMMAWFHVDEARLEREGVVITPAKTLYWDDYQYVCGHPIRWETPTALLYGGRDDICPYDAVCRFARETGADLTVLADSPHFFHTPPQLAALRRWLDEKLAQ